MMARAETRDGSRRSSAGCSRRRPIIVRIIDGARRGADPDPGGAPGAPAAGAGGARDDAAGQSHPLSAARARADPLRSGLRRPARRDGASPPRCCSSTSATRRRFGENMDPARLAVFIASFRRRVMRAAALHGGMIDKFTGDGALILFGVPEARARRCGPRARLRPHPARPHRALERQARFRPAGAHRHRHPYGRHVLRRGGRRGPARIHRAGRDRQHRRADRAGDQDGRLRLPRLAGRGDGGGRGRLVERGRVPAAARRDPQDRADGAESRSPS